ncbi:hypothetical protein ES703_34669 [subsurface metagenome]
MVDQPALGFLLVIVDFHLVEQAPDNIALGDDPGQLPGLTINDRETTVAIVFKFFDGMNQGVSIIERFNIPRHLLLYETVRVFIGQAFNEVFDTDQTH